MKPETNSVVAEVWSIKDKKKKNHRRGLGLTVMS
jgi:hypothetical protein